MDAQAFAGLGALTLLYVRLLTAGLGLLPNLVGTVHVLMFSAGCGSKAPSFHGGALLSRLFARVTPRGHYADCLFAPRLYVSVQGAGQEQHHHGPARGVQPTDGAHFAVCQLYCFFPFVRA